MADRGARRTCHRLRSPGTVLARTTGIVLVLLFGVFSIVDGIFAIAAGTASRGYFERWWALLLEGITGIAMGVLIFYWLDVTALVLMYFIAARAVATVFF